MNKNNEKLIELVKQNPDLPIIPATYYEVVQDDWGYWVGGIEDIRVDYFYMGKERWYAGEEEIRDFIYEKNESILEFDTYTNKQFDKFIDKEFNDMILNKEIIKAIIMYISMSITPS